MFFFRFQNYSYFIMIRFNLILINYVRLRCFAHIFQTYFEATISHFFQYFDYITRETYDIIPFRYWIKLNFAIHHSIFGLQFFILSYQNSFNSTETYSQLISQTQITVFIYQTWKFITNKISEKETFTTRYFQHEYMIWHIQLHRKQRRRTIKTDGSNLKEKRVLLYSGLPDPTSCPLWRRSASSPLPVELC